MYLLSPDIKVSVNTTSPTAAVCKFLNFPLLTLGVLDSFHLPGGKMWVGTTGATAEDEDSPLLTAIVWRRRFVPTPKNRIERSVKSFALELE
jgi:hypothetical protein